MSGFFAKNTPSSADGAPVVAPEAFAYAGTEKTRFVGVQYTFTAGQTASFDLQLTTNVRLQGGYYWVKDPTLNDKVSLSVVDVDDILGGGAGAVVSQYVRDMPVAPWDHQQELESPTAASIPSGLYLRVTYESVGGTNPIVGVTYRWFEESP